MNAHPPGGQPPSPNDESKFTSYQTNRIPWYIHLMWMIFAVAGIIYLLKFALADFLRWW